MQCSEMWRCIQWYFRFIWYEFHTVDASEILNHLWPKGMVQFTMVNNGMKLPTSTGNYPMSEPSTVCFIFLAGISSRLGRSQNEKKKQLSGFGMCAAHAWVGYDLDPGVGCVECWASQIEETPQKIHIPSLKPTFSLLKIGLNAPQKERSLPKMNFQGDMLVSVECRTWKRCFGRWFLPFPGVYSQVPC